MVTDTASDDENVYRIRVCNKCKKAYGSTERMDVPYQMLQSKINVLKKKRWMTR